MRKRDEMERADSCMNKALDGEMTFVLLGRDEAAPATIRAWVEERIRLGKNRGDGDPQLDLALQCARTMEAERDTIRDRILATRHIEREVRRRVGEEIALEIHTVMAGVPVAIAAYERAARIARNIGNGGER